MAASKKKAKKKAEKRFYTFHWRNIHIGFEGDASLAEPDRTRRLRSARRAIEDTFKKPALRRWTDGTRKKVRVERGAGHVHGLARLVTDELNDGVKSSVGVTFRVRSDDPIVGVELATREPVTPAEPDIKPDGTMCLWHGPRWIDVITFLLLIGRTDEAHEVVERSDGPHRVWKPDGRHGMLVRLSYDCPYE